MIRQNYPKNGVYAVLVELEGRVYQGMMNIGCRPTIERECTNTVLEVNLLNFEGDLYQKELRVYFINRVGMKKNSIRWRNLLPKLCKTGNS
jgi:riboflavin kinase/FMN adenylyltransferase